MNNSEVPTSSGIGFLGLLTILFIGLKLTGYIAWSWWWVLAPTWVPVLAAILLVLMVVASAAWYRD